MKILRAIAKGLRRGENCGGSAFRCTSKLRRSDRTKPRESLCSPTEPFFFSARSCLSGKGRKRRSGSWWQRNLVLELSKSPSGKVILTKFQTQVEHSPAAARPSGEPRGEWLRVSWSKKSLTVSLWNSNATPLPCGGKAVGYRFRDLRKGSFPSLKFPPGWRRSAGNSSQNESRPSLGWKFQGLLSRTQPI